MDNTPLGGLRPSARVVILTGAGISAESGIPTFRGGDGFWTVGSKNYRPQEMATRAAFDRMPAEVWAWYLFRRSKCLEARPNPAHHAIVRLEKHLGDRFILITQNVDGLHLAAGSSPERTYQIHGNIHYLRCNRNCLPPQPLPSVFDHWPTNVSLACEHLDQLRCSHCSKLTRPHVLWFDEYYDEPNFRFESSLTATANADLLIVVGTTGATNLPHQLCQLAMGRHTPIIVIDPNPNTLTEAIQHYASGHFLKDKAGDRVPPLVDVLLRTDPAKGNKQTLSGTTP